MLEPPKLKERFIFAAVEGRVYGLPRAPRQSSGQALAPMARASSIIGLEDEFEVEAVSMLGPWPPQPHWTGQGAG